MNSNIYLFEIKIKIFGREFPPPLAVKPELQTSYLGTPCRIVEDSPQQQYFRQSIVEEKPQQAQLF